MSKWIVTISLVLYLSLCGAFVIESGLFDSCDICTDRIIPLQSNSSVSRGFGVLAAAGDSGEFAVEEPVVAEPVKRLPAAGITSGIGYDAADAEAVVATIGAEDPNVEDPTTETGFKFQLELTSKGAAIRKATFSYAGKRKGYHDRETKPRRPLQVLSPIELADGSEFMSMANRQFVFVDDKLQLPLDKLEWQWLGVEKGVDGSEVAKFQALITDQNGKGVIKVTKSYSVKPNSYMISCFVDVENVGDFTRKIRFNMAGPAGINREGTRSDMRKIVGGYLDKNGNVISSRYAIRKFDGKSIFDEEPVTSGKGAKFLWASVVNKYFAAIAVPVAQDGAKTANWIKDRDGLFFNLDSQKNTEDEQIGISFQTLSADILAGDKKQYQFELFIGPKDKTLFDKDEYFSAMGFVQTIDFMGCCCPAGIIRPMAFFILASMNWLYTFIPNYGVVIIIFVFIIRLLIHPLTKKSQVSMSKMQTLGPKVEEIKKKYANNKQEMQKKMMEVYKEQGASPIKGMLPMFIQMPIWIALYSSIYSNIDLRGAEFLPFWITDLSAPDALVSFKAFSVPLFGKINSFNLLPIMMGVAFYLQQKLTPKAATASANPQLEQQQKMMMIMMPIMFPLLLYKAPSGLNLYIMASTFAGVIEQFIIRKHIREKQAEEETGLVTATSKTGGKAKKKKNKPFYKSYR